MTKLIAVATANPERFEGHSGEEWHELLAEGRRLSTGKTKTMAQVSDKFWSRKNAVRAAAAAASGAPVVAGESINDLVPEPTSEEEKWKRFHGRFHGRAK
jgi:hypothetical protein